MKSNKLEWAYREQLVKAGVKPQKAEQAAKTLTEEELQLISEIWSDWAVIFYQIEREILTIQEWSRVKE
ncbi:MAG: hypothetical protein AB4426_28595 [Xenococcaceae cyanobacterium]